MATETVKINLETAFKGYSSKDEWNKSALKNFEERMDNMGVVGIEINGCTLLSSDDLITLLADMTTDQVMNSQLYLTVSRVDT